MKRSGSGVLVPKAIPTPLPAWISGKMLMADAEIDPISIPCTVGDASTSGTGPSSTKSTDVANSLGLGGGQSISHQMIPWRVQRSLMDIIARAPILVPRDRSL